MKEKELRDEFAMASIHTLVKQRGFDLAEPEDLQSLAVMAYEIADACMKEREKKA